MRGLARRVLLGTGGVRECFVGFELMLEVVQDLLRDRGALNAGNDHNRVGALITGFDSILNSRLRRCAHCVGNGF